MSLRLKLVLALVLLSAFSTMAIGVTTYVATADQLKASIDDSLDQEAKLDQSVDPDHDQDQRPTDDGYGRRGDFGVSKQVIARDGTLVTTSIQPPLPISDEDTAVAAATADDVRLRHDATVDELPYRVLTISNGGPDGGARMFARSLQESNELLEDLRNRTALAVVAVTAVAALVGWLIARQVTRRLQRLTGVAEEVAATGRLDVEVPVEGRDEAGRLGVAFNEMLDALARSKDAQQRLVQDASHELRTPLTSLRTNVTVLQRYQSLRAEDRDRLITDLDTETHELTTLVDELVDLATDRRSDEPDQEVALGPLIERVAARVRRRSEPGDRGHRRRLRGGRATTGARAGHHQPGRQRGQVQRRRRRPDRDLARRGSGRGLRPGPRHRLRRPAPGVRPVLPGARRPQPPGVRSGSGHRQRCRGIARRFGLRRPEGGRRRHGRLRGAGSRQLTLTDP